MEDTIKGYAFRKLLMLDQLEGVSSVSHQLLTSHTSYNYLLFGPKRCGKTSLLFEYAFQCAMAEHDVLFITRHKLDKLPHYINSRQQPSMSTLKRIEMLYLDTLKDFLQVMTTMHLRERKYTLLIVDNLDDYITGASKDSFAIAAKVCAFVCDAVAYLRTCGLGTMLLCSMESGRGGRSALSKIIENWIPNVVQFYPYNRSGGGFTLKSESRGIVGAGICDDVDVNTLHARFQDGVIMFK